MYEAGPVRCASPVNPFRLHGAISPESMFVDALARHQSEVHPTEYIQLVPPGFAGFVAWDEDAYCLCADTSQIDGIILAGAFSDNRTAFMAFFTSASQVSVFAKMIFSKLKLLMEVFETGPVVLHLRGVQRGSEMAKHILPAIAKKILNNSHIKMEMPASPNATTPSICLDSKTSQIVDGIDLLELLGQVSFTGIESLGE